MSPILAGGVGQDFAHPRTFFEKATVFTQTIAPERVRSEFHPKKRPKEGAKTLKNDRFRPLKAKIDAVSAASIRHRFAILRVLSKAKSVRARTSDLFLKGTRVRPKPGRNSLSCLQPVVFGLRPLGSSLGPGALLWSLVL